MSMRAEANTGPENRMMDILREIGFGDLLNALITTLAVTETPTASSNVLTLAGQPTYLWDVNQTGGTVTGNKTILRGPITGSQKVTPATGQCVWDGGVKILFAAADAATTVAVKYAKAVDTTHGSLAREIGQNP